MAQFEGPTYDGDGLVKREGEAGIESVQECRICPALILIFNRPSQTSLTQREYQWCMTLELPARIH